MLITYRTPQAEQIGRLKPYPIEIYGTASLLRQFMIQLLGLATPQVVTAKRWADNKAAKMGNRSCFIAKSG
jgi:hypothetical protein